MTMKEKVLLVDDSRQARAALKEALKDVFSSFIEAEDGIAAIRAFVDEKPGFIITDVEMPSIDGYRFISTIRSMEDGRDVPIILISGTKDSLKKKLTGFNLGASDFVLKPFEGEELLARVKSLLRMRKLMEELREKNALLEKLAVTDELTGLHNRRHFFEAVREQMALGLRHGFKMACLLIDIDHFKQVNDTHGHAAGDEVLKRLGSLLSSCKRDGEILARFGGEEFIMCLFNTDSDHARLAAERFRHLIAGHDFSYISPGLKLTVSIGLALFPQERKASIDDLIRTADKAMYASKTAGRDRVTVYDPSESIPA